MIQASKTKLQILSNWSITRLLRFALAVIILIQAIQTHDVIFGIFGGIFLTQSLLNIGCCGTTACNVPVKDANETDVQFEEIKEIK